MSFRVVVVVMAAAAVMLGTISMATAQDAPPASKPAKKPPIDFRKLKEVVPGELAGVKRSSNEGEKINIGELNISQVNARFEKAEAGENDPRVELQIVDYASAPEMGNVMTAWQQMEVDKESDNGFERTTKYKEQPAYETYQNEGKSGQVQIWVASRFYVNVQTTNLTAEQMKKLVESLPLEKLVELAKS